MTLSKQKSFKKLLHDLRIGKLVEVTLSGGDLTDKLKKIAKVATTLESLTINDAYLTADDTHQLATILKKSPNLRTLSLRHVYLFMSENKGLADAIAGHTSLEKLHLDFLVADNDVFVKLMEAIKQNQSITELSLIHSFQAPHIIDGLPASNNRSTIFAEAVKDKPLVRIYIDELPPEVMGKLHASQKDNVNLIGLSAISHDVLNAHVGLNLTTAQDLLDKMIEKVRLGAEEFTEAKNRELSIVALAREQHGLTLEETAHMISNAANPETTHEGTWANRTGKMTIAKKRSWSFSKGE